MAEYEILVPVHGEVAFTVEASSPAEAMQMVTDGKLDVNYADTFNLTHDETDADGFYAYEI